MLVVLRTAWSGEHQRIREPGRNGGAAAHHGSQYTGADYAAFVAKWNLFHTFARWAGRLATPSPNASSGR